jgi:hypothetical protein
MKKPEIKSCGTVTLNPDWKTTDLCYNVLYVTQVVRATELKHAPELMEVKWERRWKSLYMSCLDCSMKPSLHDHFVQKYIYKHGAI